VTIEDVINGRMPEEYYHAPHCIYVVREGSKVYYVGVRVQDIVNYF